MTPTRFYSVMPEYSGTRPGYSVISPDYGLIKWYPVEKSEEAHSHAERLNEEMKNNG